MTTIQLSDRQLSVELLNASDLLCLPKAKEPRLLGDWAEVDGKEYDLSAPIYLEAQEIPVRLVLLSPSSDDIRALSSSETIRLQAYGSTIALRPIKVHQIDRWLNLSRWGGVAVGVEVLVSSDDLLPIFGDGAPRDQVLSDVALQSDGVKVVPDWGVLRLPPSPKVALDRSSKTANGREVYTAVGRKERSVSMEVWIGGQDPTASYLQLARDLRSNVAGHWVLGGANYYLRYQSMQIVTYLPRGDRPLLHLRLDLQQYRYE